MHSASASEGSAPSISTARPRANNSSDSAMVPCPPPPAFNPLGFPEAANVGRMLGSLGALVMTISRRVVVIFRFILKGQEVRAGRNAKPVVARKRPDPAAVGIGRP